MTTPPQLKHATAARQLAQTLRLFVQQGRWPTGSQLPTVRALAQEHGVSLNTVHLAIKELEADRLIECRPRQGAFIRPPAQWSTQVNQSAPRQVAIVRPISPGDDPRTDSTQQTSQILHGIELELATHDLHPVLLSFDIEDTNAPATIAKQVERIRDQLVGVIVFAVKPITPILFEQLDQLGITWVTINRLDHHVLENFVADDSVQCGEQIGHCLAACNARHVLVLGERTQSDMGRVAGLVNGYWAHTNHSINLEFLHLPGWREIDAYEALRDHLRTDAPLPQVVVGFGDLISVGAIRALQEHGLDIPADVGVISTTDLAIASYASPTLTTFHVPLHELGQASTQLLIRMLRNGVRRMRGQFVTGYMVYRQSLLVPAEVQGQLMPIQ